MFDLYGSVQCVLKLGIFCIDNCIFWLHYQVTFIILLAFSLIIDSKQHFGDPINFEVEELLLKVMDNYCWMYSTSTVIDISDGIVGQDISNWGILAGRQVKHHRYYQSVSLVLFLQALCFYFPRYVWNNWKDGKINMLTSQ